MQAIQTKYLGATNVKGSRIKAWCQARAVIRNWDDAENSSTNHRRAAEELANIMRWHGRWVGGTLPDGTGVFICADCYSIGSFNVEKPG